MLYSESMEELYSTRQIAQILGVKTVTIRRWVAKGELPAIDLGKEYRISEKDFQKFLEKRKIKK